MALNIQEAALASPLSAGLIDQYSHALLRTKSLNLVNGSYPFLFCSGKELKFSKTLSSLHGIK